MATNKTWNRTKRRALLLLALAATVLLTSWIVGSALIAPANRQVSNPPVDLPIESVSIESKSGSRLSGWYIPGSGDGATIVLLHGLRSDRTSMLARARLCHQQGYSTLLVDLQAHGESPGQRITFGHLESLDVEAIVEYAPARNPNHKIGIIGSSLGGAATVIATLDVDVIILESVYPTIDKAVHNRVAMRLGPLHHLAAPLLLLQLGPRLGVSPRQLCPIDQVAKIHCPILLAAGDCDRHTTLDETQQLYTQANEPKQLVVFAGAAHVDLLEHNHDKYRNQIIGFLNTYLQ